MAQVLIKYQQYITLPNGRTFGIHMLQCKAAAAETMTVPFMADSADARTCAAQFQISGDPGITVADDGAFTVTCTAAAGEQGRDFVVITSHGVGGTLNFGEEDDDLRD